MSPRERIMMLRLYEKVSDNKDYANRIGIEMSFNMNCEEGKKYRTTITKIEHYNAAEGVE